MRTFLLLITLVGCGEDPVGPIADLSVKMSPDLAVDELTCAEIIACINQCAPAMLNSCVPACITEGSSDAQTAFAPLQSCSAPACYSSDGGAPPCATPSSTACTSCVQTNCGAQLDNCLMN
jgi:hypothetical protein